MGAIQQLVSQHTSRRVIKDRLIQVAEDPALFIGDPIPDRLSKTMQDVQAIVSREPISCERRGRNIDGGALQQMRDYATANHATLGDRSAGRWSHRGR